MPRDPAHGEASKATLPREVGIGALRVGRANCDSEAMILEICLRTSD